MAASSVIVAVSPMLQTILTCRKLPKICLLAIGAVFCSTKPCCGHEPHQAAEPERYPIELLYRPSASPDRILLSWTSDPATSQAVSWRTSVDVTKAVACIAVATDGPSFSSEAVTIAAETSFHQSDLGPASFHTAVFERLEPQTTYAYRVGDGVNWSEWNQFTTAACNDRPFTFIYLGDAQNKIRSHCSRVIRQAFRTAPDASFVLHAGDLVGWGDSDGHWGEWHDAMSHFHRTVSCIATPGNHEYFVRNADGKRDEMKRLSSHWRPGFAFPENGPKGLKEAVYWLDHQGVRFISLDSNTRQDEQALWLDDVLSNNPNRWTVVAFHHPVYSARAGRDNPELRELWRPLFDRYGVDLVLQGHDHTYARTAMISGPVHDCREPATNGVTEATERGAVYVISVAGPKMYELERKLFMRSVAQGKQLYQVVHISRDSLHYDAYTATGRLHDAFILHKSESGLNTLVERRPARGARAADRVAAPALGD